jgi:hypothetical protein
MNAKDILIKVWVDGKTITPEECDFLHEQFTYTSILSLSKDSSNLDVCLHLCGLYDKFHKDGMSSIIRIEFQKSSAHTEFKKWIILNT